MPVNLAEGTVVTTVATLEPGLVRRDGSTSIAILGFNYEMDGVRSAYGGAVNQALTDDSWNYSFLDFDGSLNINTTGFPTTTHIRLAKIRCDNGGITSIIDERVLLYAAIDKNIHQETAEGQDGTTEEVVWDEKLSLGINGVEAGKYVVQWYCELRHSNNDIA